MQSTYLTISSAATFSKISPAPISVVSNKTIYDGQNFDSTNYLCVHRQYSTACNVNSRWNEVTFEVVMILCNVFNTFEQKLLA